MNPKRVMIFGRAGSGKSTFATLLSHFLGLPLYHFDKHFHIRNWVERDYNEFLQIQQEIINSKHWIVDGNSTRSLEMRFSKADLILYFNFPEVICVFRILKRFLRTNYLMTEHLDAKKQLDGLCSNICEDLKKELLRR